MIGTKLNLAILKHKVLELKGKSGMVKGIFIPIEANHLYHSVEKGNVYLDLVGFDITKPAEGQKDTHLVKQSFSKEIREKMTEEEKKAVPVIGNHTVLGSGGSAAAPQTMDDPLDSGDMDELPF